MNKFLHFQEFSYASSSVYIPSKNAKYFLATLFYLSLKWKFKSTGYFSSVGAATKVANISVGKAGITQPSVRKLLATVVIE